MESPKGSCMEEIKFSRRGATVHSRATCCTYAKLLSNRLAPRDYAEPFGATITHHRMPPNTVVCRSVAWRLKIYAGSIVRKS